MDYAKSLLRKLTKLIPPGEGQHHNLTINEDDNLVIGLMRGETFQYIVLLEEADLPESVDDLVNEICEELRISNQ